MNRILIILLISMAALTLKAQQQFDIEWSSLADSPWPMICRDPQFTGRSPYRGPQSPKVVWSVELNYGIFSGPVIGEEECLFFGTYYNFSGGLFYSYTRNGQLNWIYHSGTDGRIGTGILIDSSNTIYVGSADSNFYAFYPEGRLKWKIYGERFASILIPNIDKQGNLYITNWEGELLSIAPEGNITRRISHGDSLGFWLSSPVFSPDGETIYIAGYSGDLYALNLDGTLKWKFECGRIIHPPFTDNEGNIYIMPEESPAYIFSLKPGGSIRWQYYTGEWVIEQRSKGTIDKWGNIYFVAYDNLNLSGFTLISLTYSGSLRWHYYFPFGEEFTQPLLCDSEGTVYLGTTDGSNYYAINNDGNLKWQMPLNDHQVDNTGAIGSDGTLYLGVHLTSLHPMQGISLIAIRDTTTTSVSSTDLTTKGDYFLSRNYPNPFNPTTKIEYSVLKKSEVYLRVYNSIGEIVAILVRETKDPGTYSVDFNGSDLPSGIYIYTLTAGEYNKSNKMVLLK